MVLWGKLFPFSPIYIGFAKIEMPRSIVYVQNGATFKDYAKIDALIPPVEEFHELKFIKKPRIFIFRDDESYRQRTSSKGRCVTCYGRILVSPRAFKDVEEGKISLDIYLKHELSHAILFQNQGAMVAFRFRYPKWLSEGIAVYSANQLGTSEYPSKQETYQLIHSGNFMPPRYFRTKAEKQVKLNVKNQSTFLYSEFACIVDYLVETGGKGKFLLYMKSLLKRKDHDKIFKEIYGIDFDQFILNFRARIEKI